MIIFYARVDDGGLPPVGVCKHVKERLLIYAAPKASFFMHRRGFYVKKWIKVFWHFLMVVHLRSRKKGIALQRKINISRTDMPCLDGRPPWHLQKNIMKKK